MKQLMILAFAGLLLAACGDDSTAEKTVELKTNKDKLSYAVGADHAKQLLNDPGFDNYDKKQIMDGFAAGIRDASVFGPECQQTLQNMMGMGQFNPSYKDEGSLCIGKAMGAFFLNGWKQQNFVSRFDLNMVELGFNDALDRQDTLVPAEESHKMVSALISELNEKLFAESSKNEALFFGKVRSIKGIKDLGNGLYLETIREGTGSSPKPGDDVEAHYVLISAKGDTLQSSLGSPQVPAFSLNQVVQGWMIAFPKLKTGGKYRLYVPQALGYGGQPPQGSSIEPYSPLEFYIELVNFGKPGTLAK